MVREGTKTDTMPGMELHDRIVIQVINVKGQVRGGKPMGDNAADVAEASMVVATMAITQIVETLMLLWTRKNPPTAMAVSVALNPHNPAKINARGWPKPRDMSVLMTDPSSAHALLIGEQRKMPTSMMTPHHHSCTKNTCATPDRMASTMLDAV